MRELTEAEIAHVSGGIADPTYSDPRFYQLGAVDDILNFLGALADALEIADFFGINDPQPPNTPPPSVQDFEDLQYVGTANDTDGYLQEGTGILFLDQGRDGTIDIIQSPSGGIIYPR